MAIDLDDLVNQLDESPWDARELLEPLGAADRAAVRTKLLARCRATPTSGVVSVLGAFAGDDVIDALEAVLHQKVGRDVFDEVPQAIGTIGGARAEAILVKLVDHPELGVARYAIERLPASDATVTRIVDRFDTFAARHDDMLLSAAVEKLVSLAASDPRVIAALARNWDFAIRSGKTLVASNAIFDALVEHAPRSPVAQKAFAAAAAHDDEYAQVRGFAALALTGTNTVENTKALKKLKVTLPSSRSLRKKALDNLAKLVEK